MLFLCLCLFIAVYLLFFPVPWYKSEVGRNGDALSAITKPINGKTLALRKRLIHGVQDLNLDPAHIEESFTLQREGIPLIVECLLFEG